MPSEQLGRRHPRHDGRRPPVEVGQAQPALEELGARQHHRPGRPASPALSARGRLLEVVLRRGLGTEHAFAPFDVVQIDLEDPPLVEQHLEHAWRAPVPGPCAARCARRTNSRLFASFCVMVEPPRSRTGRTGLPRDSARRAPGGELFGPSVALAGALDGFPLHADMVDEVGVLAGDDGALEGVADLHVGHPFTAPSALSRPCGWRSAKLRSAGTRCSGIEHGHLPVRCSPRRTAASASARHHEAADRPQQRLHWPAGE